MAGIDPKVVRLDRELADDWQVGIKSLSDEAEASVAITSCSKLETQELLNWRRNLKASLMCET